jgi:hypothetical protein
VIKALFHIIKNVLLDLALLLTNRIQQEMTQFKETKRKEIHLGESLSRTGYLVTEKAELTLLGGPQGLQLCP